MRYLLLSILILFIVGCKKQYPNAQQSPPALSDAQSVSQQVIMDYYQQNSNWPDSAEKLASFCDDNSANYSANATKICQSLKLRSLKNGYLYVVSNIDVNDSDPRVKVLAKRIDPNTIKNLTWRTTMILSPSGQAVDESKLDEHILNEIKQDNYTIQEPISVKSINN